MTSQPDRQSATLSELAVELHPAEAVQAGVDRMVNALQPLVLQRPCILLGIMTGGLFLLAGLAQRLQGDFIIDVCRASRYGAAQEGSQAVIQMPPTQPMAGKTVIVVDDILDEGITLAAVMEHCHAAGAAAVYSALLAVKDTPRLKAVMAPDFSTGLVVPDVFVFGCGMDLAGHWRHLPAIYALRTA